MLKDRVTEIMTSEGGFPFWSLATLLLGASSLYGAAVRLRRRMYRQGVVPTLELPCPVISVGNLTMGGTGKTPLAIHLAEQIDRQGYRAAIISRGYQGLYEKGGGVVSDGRTLLCDARHAGDEPFLMAALLPRVPVVVGRNRHAAGLDAVRRFKPDIIVLDDGFQHLRLKRDLNIVLLDAQNPFGNGYLLPRGTLREPAAALENADVVILTRSDSQAAWNHSGLVRRLHPRPVFRSRHAALVRTRMPARHPLGTLNPGQDSAGSLQGGKVFAFSGLGRNRAFFDALRQSGADLQGVMGFEDHHPYCADDLDRIGLAATKSGARHLVTTDKDFVRLPQNARLPLELIVIGVQMDFDSHRQTWQEYIQGKIDGLLGK
jgi:tetraacyldisaccharide 4'-kinase